MNGRYKVEELFEDSDSESELNESLLSRNFFCYSLFKIAPVAIQPSLYNKGNYNSATALGATAEAYAMGGDMTQHLDGVSKATGVDGDFLDSFAVIENLPSIMSVSQGDENTFLMMSNNTTHEIVALQEPEYVPAMVVDNTDFDKEHETRTDEFGNVVDFSDDTESRATSRSMHYQVNMATMLKLAEWFDYMKECGVYDNTRIILVSDHSQGLGFHEELLQTVEDLDTGETWAFDEYVFNCLLMVKDFDSQEFTYDNTFMTNADTPVMALDGIVDDPVNPFTGNPIDSSAKDAPEMHLFASNEWHVDINNGNEFMPGEWFSVHDDVSDEANWEYLGYY